MKSHWRTIFSVYFVCIYTTLGILLFCIASYLVCRMDPAHSYIQLFPPDDGPGEVRNM